VNYCESVCGGLDKRGAILRIESVNSNYWQPPPLFRFASDEALQGGFDHDQDYYRHQQ
jgi:hypothetical protein